LERGNIAYITSISTLNELGIITTLISHWDWFSRDVAI